MKLILFLLLSFLSSCLPQTVAPRVTEQNVLDSSTVEDAQKIETKDDFESKAQWFNKGEFVNVLTVDLANKQNGYIRGGVVNSFLQDDLNFRSNFCMVVDFQQAPGKTIRQYRTKLIPNQYTDYKTGKNIRYFRVNIITETGNEICDINEAKKNSLTGNFDISPRPANLVVDTEQVCIDCLNIISSQTVKFFKIISVNAQSFIEKIQDTQIDTSALLFRIDVNNFQLDQPASCSDTNCKGLGFDCCRQGQCINEKSQNFTGISQDPTGFQLAELEKFTDPNWYLKYPQFYFSCLENPAIDQADLIAPIDPTDPDGEADTRLLELIADYKCIKELEEKSQSDPFHIDPINTTATYSECSLNNTDTMFYESVMTRMYEQCGCSETQFSQMVENCPNYSYKAIFSQSNNVDTETIESIECSAPEADPGEVAFQDLQVYLNSKSVPHRFFNEDNVEIDPTSPINDSVSTNQEGTEFLYLDQDGEKITPINGEFNMNSILGQINLNLGFARPAKIIKILPNTVYQIAVMNGSYTPCPSCANDSWFSNFSAHPTTNNGLGLQAVGSTTQRDNWGTNFTLGNYEDTIFGRACWVPPTMLPYSHLENEDVQTQRLNRLKTQAALFINGYQRDWYGFNKGAIIGSFDGVTWFAIGKSRLIESKSNRLYLAINAPFADLATANDHLLNIHQVDIIPSGSFFDYDPNEELISPDQNEAGMCQSFHLCKSDADCISNLGWEYSCVDTSVLKTKWPSFTQIFANENANESKEGNITNFLGNPEQPSGGSKRCVYRGAGAPCRKDYENISGLNLRKSLACAPNFYCASVNTQNVFNKEIARFAQPLESLVEARNHLFGQDADILGRPKHYAKNGELFSFNETIKQALIANIKVQDDTVVDNNIGICRPGKKLPNYKNSSETISSLPEANHKDFDPNNRTDYINQISGCNSTLYTNLRYSSCPMLDSSGNYIHTDLGFLQDIFINTNNLFNEEKVFNKEQTLRVFATSQNSCGLESLENGTTFNKPLNSADSIKDRSPFKLIEGDELSGSVKTAPTLTRDACLRKAGSVCHTDLDCSPNKLMAQQIDLFGDSFFGNLAEKKYYEEYLICGQGISEPFPGDENIEEFSNKNNRCCREVGKDLTIYTPNTPGVDESTGLKIDKFGGFFPNDPNRYSRFSSLELDINTDGTANFELYNKLSLAIADSPDDTDINPDIFTKFQWQTIGKVASKTCCGGGYIRKFADGTNNWQINRLVLDPINFKCLNSNTPLLTTKSPEEFGTTTSFLDFDRSSTMCLDTSFQTGGCAMVTIPSDNDIGEVTQPILNQVDSFQEVHTISSADNPEWSSHPFAYSIPRSNDSNDFPFLNWSLPFDEARKNIHVYVPSWVSYTSNQFESEVTVQLESSLGAISCEKITPTNKISGPVDSFELSDCPNPNSGSTASFCCYEYNEDTRILGVSYGKSGSDVTDPTLQDNFEKDDIKMVLIFTAPGTLKWEIDHASNTLDEDIEHRRSSRPGDMNYYLDRLARLELVGIPQITYLPIYCNNNYQKVIPGIFDDEIKTVHDFINNSNLENEEIETPWLTDSATDRNANSINTKHVVTQDKLKISPIFSSHEFMCCKKLGSTTTDPTKCCSGYAISGNDSNDQNLTCALPSGTDLNVYFNRFVSNEGYKDVGNDNTANEDFLGPQDYHEETGEPRQNSNVLIKLKRLGARFCETNQVVRGGAFGTYTAEINGRAPAQGPDVFNIVDSNFDNSQTSQGEARGFVPFSSGLRWNHHIYCAF